MPIPSASDIIQYIHVLGTEVSTKTKRVLAQIGSNEGEQQSENDNIEWTQHVGFASRPTKTVKGKNAAAAVVLRVGNRELAIASFDERGLEMYGNLDHGEACVYAPGEDGTGQGRIILKKDGSINMYTRKGNTSGGVGMLMQLDATNGAIRLINDKGYGLIIDSDGVKLLTDKAALTLGSDGTAKLIGTGMAQLDGSNVCLGSIAIPVINGICVGPAGLVAVCSAKCFAALA